MDTGTLFYVCGSALAVSALVTAVVGVRFEKLPGRLAPFVALWFAALIGATTTLAVLHAQDEQRERSAELSKASEEAEREEAQ